MSDEDKNHLDSSLVECCRRYGITFDNDTVTDTDGQFREMPVIADWDNVLQENPETKHLAGGVDIFTTETESSLAFPRLSDYARLHGKNGRLTVLVNFCLDEYCSRGKR